LGKEEVKLDLRKCKKMVTGLLIFVGLIAWTAGVVEAGYPEKPITVSVPWPPGGASDVIIQRGTMHNWVNRGIEPCIIAFILIAMEGGQATGW
jgi:hypothetical protein